MQQSILVCEQELWPDCLGQEEVGTTSLPTLHLAVLIFMRFCFLLEKRENWGLGGVRDSEGNRYEDNKKKELAGLEPL